MKSHTLITLIMFITALLLFHVTSVNGASLKLLKNDFTSWPRANVTEFGCFLEKEFKLRDKKFNCDLKNYQNHGDPCKNTEEYYEGPIFPKDKTYLVSDRIEEIHLSWEHGDLQNISVTLKRKYDEKELKQIFKLPQNASIQNCSKKSTCIVLIGFDHMGAGDVECGEN